MRKAWENAKDEIAALRPVEPSREDYFRFWEVARNFPNYSKKVPPDLGGLHVYAFGPLSDPEVETEYSTKPGNDSKTGYDRN